MSIKNQAFDWNRAKAFWVTAQQGSLSAAARVLGSTQPTVGRQIAALETELGLTLFERVPQGLTLTESGLELLECVTAMGEAATELSLRATGQSRNIEGPVCVSASELQAVFTLPNIIEKIRLSEPGIHIEVVVDNDVSDLKQRDADIAIRNFRPTQPDLIIRKLRQDNVWFYGTPNYLAAFDGVASPAECSGLELVGYERTESFLTYIQQKGFPVTLANVNVASKSYFMQWAMVEQGLGVGIFTESLGDRNPNFVRAFEHFGPLTEVPTWLVCHRELHTSLRVRKVFDMIANELGAND